jgi:rubrerythrin
MEITTENVLMEKRDKTNFYHLFNSFTVKKCIYPECVNCISNLECIKELAKFLYDVTSKTENLQVEKKQEKWEIVEDGGRDYLHCPYCGEEWRSDEKNIYTPDFKHCPCCGARLEAPEELK